MVISGTSGHFLACAALLGSLWSVPAFCGQVLDDCAKAKDSVLQNYCAGVKLYCKGEPVGEIAQACQISLTNAAIGLAAENQSPAYCEEVTDPRKQNQCIAAAAQFKEDVKLCDRIKDVGGRNECLEVVPL